MTNKNEKFNESLKERYKYEQIFFCENQLIFNNTLLEERLKIVNAYLDNITFEIFVYKKEDSVSNIISTKGNFESSETKNILSALLYYSKKKHK